MTIKINFDAAHVPEEPTIVLAKRNGDKIGKIPARSIDVNDSMTDAAELGFNVFKFFNGEECPIWDQIVSFKLAYCVEWDMWFEMTVEIDESDETRKTCMCTQLGHAELSQIMLYDININTEEDISRDEYEIPTVLYNPEHPEASLLHRIMEKAPHYSVRHVDGSIAKIQRTFDFSDTSIYDAFQEIAEEIHCLFVFDSNSDSKGKINRVISVYDLEANCMECGNRGEFSLKCPKCESENVNEGYGNDTTIFVTSDEIADDIQWSADTASIKNCFKLDGGDDLMNAAIRSCNPNGTDYIWYLPDSVRNEMSDELREKINGYDDLYVYYRNDHIADVNSSVLSKYNSIVRKYKPYKDDLQELEIPIKGYPAISKAYFDTIDFEIYLRDALMPDAKMGSTTAKDEVRKFTVPNMSPIGYENIESLTVTTANNLVMSMAKVVIDSRYKIRVENTNFVNDKENFVCRWTGKITVTNYSDNEDTATSSAITIVINDNFDVCIKNKIDTLLSKDDAEEVDIVGLFKKSLADFKSELRKYCLSSLSSFQNCCQTCIDTLIEQGVGSKETWSGQKPNLYNDLYVPYKQKLTAIGSEIAVRESEINLVTGVYDENGDLKTAGLQSCLKDVINDIRDKLNFQDYIGNDLWLELCSFRREDKYSNDNYISDGLNNAELMAKASEFIEVANKEIYRSAELQHSISASLKNLLVIDKFSPIVDDFRIGNWIRVMIDDEVYKLRLVGYSIDYESLDSISVSFSDTVRAKSSVMSVKDVISSASSMATSYSSVQRQAKQGEKTNDIINGWADNGFDATNTKIVGGADGQSQTWDEHGILLRRYNSIDNAYDPVQMKIINSTIAITDDNWESTKTAVGNFYYNDPETGELVKAYGINGEVLVGKLMIGEGLGLYNDSGTMKFDSNGLSVSNGAVSVKIDPNSNSVLSVDANKKVALSFDDEGNLFIKGNIIANTFEMAEGGKFDVSTADIGGFASVAFSGKYNDLEGKPELKSVATSGSYNDLVDKPDIPEKIDISGKFDNPSNNNSASAGQYLVKQKSGSKWVSADDSIDSSSNNPVSGKAVSDYAVAKNQGSNNAGKLMYVGEDGNVSLLSIDDLRNLLLYQQ